MMSEVISSFKDYRSSTTGLLQKATSSPSELIHSTHTSDDGFFSRDVKISRFMPISNTDSNMELHPSQSNGGFHSTTVASSDSLHVMSSSLAEVTFRIVDSTKQSTSFEFGSTLQNILPIASPSSTLEHHSSSSLEYVSVSSTSITESPGTSLSENDQTTWTSTMLTTSKTSTTGITAQVLTTSFPNQPATFLGSTTSVPALSTQFFTVISSAQIPSTASPDGTTTMAPGTKGTTQVPFDAGTTLPQQIFNSTTIPLQGGTIWPTQSTSPLRNLSSDVSQNIETSLISSQGTTALVQTSNAGVFGTNVDQLSTQVSEHQSAVSHSPGEKIESTVSILIHGEITPSLHQTSLDETISSRQILLEYSTLSSEFMSSGVKSIVTSSSQDFETVTYTSSLATSSILNYRETSAESTQISSIPDDEKGTTLWTISSTSSSTPRGMSMITAYKEFETLSSDSIYSTSTEITSTWTSYEPSSSINYGNTLF